MSVLGGDSMCNLCHNLEAVTAGERPAAHFIIIMIIIQKIIGIGSG
jgi:hypothetical protein